MIKKIATLGRANTKECVTEYIIQFSDDGEMWRSYVNPDGEVQVNDVDVNIVFVADFFQLFYYRRNDIIFTVGLVSIGEGEGVVATRKIPQI